MTLLADLYVPENQGVQSWSMNVIARIWLDFEKLCRLNVAKFQLFFFSVV